MKIIKSLVVLAIAGTMALTACNNNAENSSISTDSSSRGTVDSASPKHDSTRKDSLAANAVGNTNPDQATIDYLIPGNAKEIAWLIAGEKNTANKEIKAHSKMMLADHEKLGQQVAALVSSKNLTAPPPDTIGAVDINDLKGKEWDKAWVDRMVKGHQELLDKLKQSEPHVKDSSLKKIVVDAEPIVQGHLDMVKKLQGQMK